MISGGWWSKNHKSFFPKDRNITCVCVCVCVLLGDSDWSLTNARWESVSTAASLVEIRGHWHKCTQVPCRAGPTLSISVRVSAKNTHTHTHPYTSSFVKTFTGIMSFRVGQTHLVAKWGTAYFEALLWNLLVSVPLSMVEVNLSTLSLLYLSSVFVKLKASAKAAKVS